MKKIMNSKLPAKQRNGIFYKIFLKINQIFRKNKYKTWTISVNMFEMVHYFLTRGEYEKRKSLKEKP